MKNKIRYILFLLGMMVVKSTYAVCPLCTVAVGAGLGASHWAGVDDVISGLWIGGFVMSLVIWTIAWFNQKNIHFKGRKIITTATYYSFVIIPFSLNGTIGQPFNKMWGMDKVVLGMTIGSIVFLLGYVGHILLKARRGRIYFRFQKVAMSIGPLVVLTVLFYGMNGVIR